VNEVTKLKPPSKAFSITLKTNKPKTVAEAQHMLALIDVIAAETLFEIENSNK
jgi:hypothetical protein